MFDTFNQTWRRLEHHCHDRDGHDCGQPLRSCAVLSVNPVVALRHE